MSCAEHLGKLDGTLRNGRWIANNEIRNMNKLWLIIQREYLTRVRKKSFILITLLSPILMVGIFTLPVLLVSMSGDDEQLTLAVKDDSGMLADSLPPADNLVFTLRSEPLDELRRTYEMEGYDGLLQVLPLQGDSSSATAVVFTAKQFSVNTERRISGALENKIGEYKMRRAGYDENVINSFRTEVQLELRSQTIDENGAIVESDKKGSAEVATAIGFIAGFVIYIILVFYGAMIMRSVMEEKSSRIVEVIISSVRPFYLMLGKIIGVSAVGLTQMILWFLLVVALMSVVGIFIPMDATATMGSPMNGMSDVPELSQFTQTLDVVLNQNWALILPVFLFFFVGGYFIYSSMFAAVGSAMGDDMGEGQSLTLLVMLPIIFSIIMLAPIIEHPDSSLATWFSLIPLTSPVIMPARIAFDPPLWELILSMLLLAGSSVFFVWLSARIYRVGILMYGKRASFKELGKWLFYKD